MKKSLFVLPAATVLALGGLIGCGPKSDDYGGKTVIKYLVSQESDAYKNILNQVISDFNKSIEKDGYVIVPTTPGGDYYESLGRLIAANNTPDIFMMESGFFSSYSHLMADLTGFLDNSTVLDESDLWDLNDYYKDGGKLKALIKDFSPDFMMIYNKTMLENYNSSVPEEKRFTISDTVPMTWLEFYEMTSAIQHAGFADYGTSLGFEGTKHLHEIVQQTGTRMYTLNYKEVNVNDSNLREAFAFFYSLQKSNVNQSGTDTSTEIAPYAAIQNATTDKKAPAAYTSGSTTSEQELFKQGRCFSIFNGLYSFPSYNFYNVNFEYGVAPHPVQNAGDDPFGTTSAMVSHAISSRCRHKDIAWRFLEYYQTEGLQKLAKIAFNIPGNKTIAGSDAFLEQSNPKVQEMVNYFYNFVNQGYCVPTVYNDLIDYKIISSCFNTAQSKYFSTTNTMKFSGLINQINLYIKEQTRDI